MRPGGVPLSRALMIRSGIANDELREAVAAINRVHGDGDVPAIPVHLVGNQTLPRSDGRFWFDVADDGSLIPEVIGIRIGAPSGQVALLHEVGHFLDIAGMPGPGFASLEWPGLRAWRHRIVRTASYKSLALLADQGQANAAALAPLEEMWARSYAQFVTIRGGSARLRAWLDSLRWPQPGKEYHVGQWVDDDFAPIESAIEDVFRRLRWIRL